MINLFNADTRAPLGSITEAQLAFMQDQFEEESLDDQDYAISEMTLAYFEEIGADPALVALLRNALGAQDEITIAWEA